MRSFRTVLICVLMIALAGCASRGARVPRVPGSALPPAVTNEIVTRLAECNSDIRSFRGLARASMTQGEERSAFRYAIVFEKPGSLRLEALPSSAVYTLSLLLTSAGELTYLDPASKSFHRGPIDAPAFKRFLGVPVLPADLMMILTACVSPDSGGEVSVFEDAAAGGVQVRSKKYIYEAATDSLELRKAYLLNNFDESVALLVEWESYQEVQGRRIPQSMTLSIPAHSVSLHLNFTSTEINGDYPERLFHAAIPADYEPR